MVRVTWNRGALISQRKCVLIFGQPYIVRFGTDDKALTSLTPLISLRVRVYTDDKALTFVTPSIPPSFRVCTDDKALTSVTLSIPVKSKSVH